ncbi:MULTISPECIES: OmpA family protein [Pseudanabaena]|uniref:OmpA/MotB domain protein n=2 Tax=Pseudanabaena TaxID=1152 RepID=L8MV96_9CYAN|nr:MULTISPECIES: OmpA family protein [Pseudanabaena]ELS30390.1 OmpA/MotB domain protein [Pseudanabaena biceps PCC 7429]MDG3497331.1 OmpA family protein [Pseudanabaena catenata USMAC16]
MLHENNSETNELGELGREVGAIKDEVKINPKSFQMPANLVANEFGEVNVFRDRFPSPNNPIPNDPIPQCRVEFTIAMEPEGKFAEGWRTGLALDASASMKRAYGRKVEARVDPELLTAYIKEGRLRSYLEDGEPIRKIQRDAFAEIKERGYEVNYTENILQPLVQNFTAYLAENLDGTGKTSLLYWGCGAGDEIQVLGEFDAVSCQQLAIAGPATFKLGKTTKLLPAIAYFVDRNRQAPRGIYIFLTDGRIDDLEQVKNYTKELALEIAVGKRNYLKLILIGIGNDVDRYQLQELDDLDTGLDIDLWDYKIASEMTSLTQIFAEVVNDHQIIAANGAIYDDRGNCVKAYTHGLPARIDFMMPHDCQWFELVVGDRRIRQSVVLGAETAAIAPLAAKKLWDFETLIQEPNSALVVVQPSVINDQPKSTNLWKILAAVLIGMAFAGTAIAFGILIKRSDDSKLQNASIPTIVKESIIESEVSSSDRPSNTTGLNNPSKANPSKANPSKANPSKANPSKANPDDGKSISNNPNSPDITNGNNKLGNNRTNPSNDKSLDRSASNSSEKITDDNSSNKSSVTKAENNSINSPQNNVQNSTQNSAQRGNGINPTGSFTKITGDLALKTAFPNFLKPNPNIDSNGKDPNSRNTNSGNSANSSLNNSLNNINSGTPSQNGDRLVNSILPVVNPDLEVTIFFPSDESQLLPPEEAKIDSFWTKVQGRRGVIQVSGHTDTTGDYAYNLDLSQARANEVVRILRDRGLDNNYKVTFEALSWLQPLKKNNTARDNAFNRRVVLQFKEQR